MMYDLKQRVEEEFSLKDCILSMGTSADFEEAVIKIYIIYLD